MVKEHLEENGMDKTYTRWVFHGEAFEEMSEDEDVDGGVGVEQRCDGLQEILADVCVGRYEMDINVKNIPQGEASSSHGPSAADEDTQPSDVISNDLDPQPFNAMLNDLHLPLYPGSIQVFYLKETKLRGDWKVVQIIKPRNVYDVLEVDEEEEDSIGGDVFQQEEQLEVDGIVRHHQTPDLMDNEENDEEVEPLSLNRTDVDAYEVDANVVVINVE
ncbi:hypothetical protein MRB53_034660 [Persea americana]|uniref:Uncharacterized protein n=1 Tax=Persea americana TaxID=3435 RepID=A0ACC2K2S2_PERAE|nr:hypothetical protein MRB53_034660 [Persea americana]